MNRFKAGDRVVVARSAFKYDSRWFVVGNVGVVQEYVPGAVVVMFDKDARGNHDYWYVDEADLELES